MDQTQLSLKEPVLISVKDGAVIIQTKHKKPTLEDLLEGYE